MIILAVNVPFCSNQETRAGDEEPEPIMGALSLYHSALPDPRGFEHSGTFLLCMALSPAHGL